MIELAHFFFKNRDWSVDEFKLQAGHYENGNLALLLKGRCVRRPQVEFDAYWQDWCKLTVNVVPLEPYHFIFHHGLSKDLVSGLIDNSGWFIKTDEVIKYGFDLNGIVFKLCPEFIKKIEREVCNVF